MDNTLTSPPMKPNVRPERWDRVGIWLSGLCIIHCLIMPAALAVLPLWPAIFKVDAWIHPLSAFLLLPPTLIAMRTAYRKQLGTRMQISFGIGLTLIFVAWLAHGILGTIGETLVTLVGSSLLIYGHWHNWRS